MIGRRGSRRRLVVAAVACALAHALVPTVSADTHTEEEGLAVAAGHAYVASGDTLLVYDVADSDSPELVAEAQLSELSVGLAASGSLLGVVGRSGLTLFDITEPSELSPVGRYAFEREQGLGMVGMTPDKAYVWAYDPESGPGVASRLLSIDISNPAAPREVGRVATTNAPSADTEGVAAIGAYAFAVSNHHGVGRSIGHLDTITLDTLEQRGDFEPPDRMAEVFWDLSVSDHFAAIQCDCGVACSDPTLDVRLVDIADPETPANVMLLEAVGRLLGNDDEHLYVHAEAQMLSVISLHEADRGALVGAVMVLGDVRDFVTLGDTLYLTLEGQGRTDLLIVDATDPTHPACVGGDRCPKQAWLPGVSK